MKHRSLVKFLYVLGIVCLAVAAQGTALAQSQPSCTPANGSNFNGNAIAGGNFIWFNAVVKFKGIDRTVQTTIGFFGSISFTSGSTTYEMNVPDGIITFSPTATEASTSFDGESWITVVPSSFSQEIFLSGLSFQVPEGGLAGGINPVTWSGMFITSEPQVTGQWKWGAAVYTQFSTEEATVGAKPVDGDKANPYHNSDHAGTPENFKPYVTGGARGGGGSNWTGSYSGTAAVCFIGPE